MHDQLYREPDEARRLQSVGKMHGLEDAPPAHLLDLMRVMQAMAA